MATMSHPGRRKIVADPVEGLHFSSTLLRKWIANELKRLRIGAGKTHADVVERLSRAKAWASHVENGEYLPTPRDVEILFGWYGHSDRVADFNLMVKAAKKNRDWWSELDALPDWAQFYLGLESGVDKLCGYEPIVVH